MNISLKTQNVPLLVIYLVWCCSVYFIFAAGWNDFGHELSILFRQLNSPGSVLVAIAPLICFIFIALIGADNKAIITFWRLKNPLPGSRAFSDLGPSDYRIDMNIISEKIGSLPIEPREQNKTWYKLYKKVEDNVSVKSSHREYLLARDLACIAFWFLIITPGLLFAGISYLKVGLYAMAMIVQYIILCLATQNLAKRFVCNVLSDFSCTQGKL